MAALFQYQIEFSQSLWLGKSRSYSTSHIIVTHCGQENSDSSIRGNDLWIKNHPREFPDFAQRGSHLARRRKKSNFIMAQKNVVVVG